MNSLGNENMILLEELKKEGFNAWTTEPNKSSGYREYIFETPDGHIFMEDEITRRYCQGCEDDMEELGIDEIDECTCSKEKYREKVRKILDLLRENETEVLEIFGK